MPRTWALLLFAGIGFVSSQCPDCTGVPFVQVCAANDLTYPSRCFVERINCFVSGAKIEVLYEGACLDYAARIPRPLLPQPNITYTPLDCSLWPGPICPRMLDVRCGNDYVNYDNECMMCRAKKTELNTRHPGICTDYELALTGQVYPVGIKDPRKEIDPLKLPMKPDCRNARILCSRLYGIQVCGSDGETYSSECDLCNRKREAELRGEPFDVQITKMAGIC